MTKVQDKIITNNPLNMPNPPNGKHFINTHDNEMFLTNSALDQFSTGMGSILQSQHVINHSG